jgi:hypothetical protein
VSTENLILASNLLVVLATLWLVYATLKAANVTMGEVVRSQARTNRLLARILANVVVRPCAGRHRGDAGVASLLAVAPVAGILSVLAGVHVIASGAALTVLFNLAAAVVAGAILLGAMACLLPFALSGQSGRRSPRKPAAPAKPAAWRGAVRLGAIMLGTTLAIVATLLGLGLAVTVLA